MQTNILKVYHDGPCPLCRVEIRHYGRQPGGEHFTFIDVSKQDAFVGVGLSRLDAMARFHVRDGSGQLLSGAAASVAVWARLRGWRWAARVAKMPGALPVLEVGYILFLPMRSYLASIIGAFDAKRG